MNLPSLAPRGAARVQHAAPALSPALLPALLPAQFPAPLSAALAVLAVLSLLAGLLTLAPAAQAQPLGRLFATPAERETMEAQRGAATGPTAVAMPEAGVQPVPPDPNQPLAGTAGTPAAAAPSAPNALVMGGVLRSSSGRSTVWLNNVAQNDGQNRFSNRSNAAVSITLPSGQRLILKPGQRYDLDAARVKDVNEP
ncbi:hypothetical protein [Duganella fentianensis]|uniref:hypothetical protein n=1 Tax=Duganella fentianensis TaxID=2692177 RepID=UPI0032B2CD47